MSGSTWLTTVGMTTVDDISCIAFEVMSSSGGDAKKGDIALGVSFAVAFVVGGLLALVASVLIFRHIARKGKVFSLSESRDVENSDEKQSATNSYQRLKRGSEPSVTNEDWGSELQRRDTLHVPNELHISLNVIALGDRNNIDSCDFLSLASTSDRQVDLLRLGMVAAMDLERTLMEERINAKLLCMREVLATQLKRNKLTKSQVNETLQKVFYSVDQVVSGVQRQRDVGSEVLKKKASKDPQVMEIDMMKAYVKSLTAVTMAIRDADEVFRRALNESTKLTADEVKAMAESLSENMARLESRLGDERMQQTVFLEEGHTKRNCLSETVELREDSLVAEISGRQDAISRVLQGLQLESTISDKAKTEVQRCFADELKSIQSKMSLESQRTKLNQAALLKQVRQEKLTRLMEEHSIRIRQFFVMLDRTGTGNGLAQTYLELESEARRKRNDVEDDLDQEEAEAVHSIYEEFERVSQKSLAAADEHLSTIFRSQGRLSERDANNALRLYQAQLQQEQRMMNIETSERMRQIRERLPSADDNSEENALARLGSEEEELRKNLERLLRGIFRTQTLLTPEAMKSVQKQHQQKLIGVTNQLVMANRRSQKMLIWLNRMRRRLTEDLSDKAEELAKNSKDKKTKKLMEKTKSRKAGDSQQLEKVANDLEECVRLEAKRTEEEILKDHDSCLAELIGHQVAAEARKRALMNVQRDTTISKLEDRIMNELDIRHDHSETMIDGYVDVISQQHLTEISEMIEEMGLVRSRRDDLIAQKMESRQHTREREIASDLNQQARNQWNENKNFLLEHFERITFQQLFQDSLVDLKLDCTVEMERLREEVSVELENELHQQLTEQKKIFLAQVIALAKVPKDVIEDLVIAAVTEAGGDDKQASKLLKEFLLEVQKAKVNSGFDLHRPPPKTKSSDSLLAFDHRNPTKIQRSKTDLGLTPHPLSARDELERPKSRLHSYPNRSYLNSDDDTSSIDQPSSPQRPRSAYKRSAEV